MNLFDRPAVFAGVFAVALSLATFSPSTHAEARSSRSQGASQGHGGPGKHASRGHSSRGKDASRRHGSRGKQASRGRRPGGGGGGSASWYGPGFHGKRTASGERFNQNSLTAAHRSLPFGTQVKVTNSANGRSVVVRINDRGPFHGGRVIDLSHGAASKLGMVNSGTARVTLEVQRKG